MKDEKTSMKTFIGAFIGMILILTYLAIAQSCDRNKCWRCEVHTKYFKPNPSGPIEYIGVYEFCDVTDEYIRQFAKNNAYTDSLIQQIVICDK